MNSSAARPILIVEDADADYEALVRAFAAADPTQILIRECSAEAAVLRLEGLIAARSAMPTLAMIDLNLPGRNGLSFVAQLKKDPRFCALPVVVLTSSTNPRDTVASYAAGANAFMAKPFELKEFVKAIAVMHQFWSAAAKVPPSEAYFEATQSHDQS